MIFIFQVRLKTSQAFHGVIHARDSRDNACLTYGTIITTKYFGPINAKYFCLAEINDIVV